MRKKHHLLLAGVVLAISSSIGCAATISNQGQSWSSSAGLTDTDFEYNSLGSGSYAWDVTNDSHVSITGTSRLFVGSGISGGANLLQTLNITSSDHNGGTIYISGNSYAGFRIGHNYATSQQVGGILNINDGVVLQTANYVWGDGSNTKQINIGNGGLEIYASNAANLKNITLNLGVNGELWVQGLTTASAGAFLTSNNKQILLDAGLSASEYAITYQSASKTSLAGGAAQSGIVFSVASIPEPSTYAFAGVIAAGAILMAVRCRRN